MPKSRIEWIRIRIQQRRYDLTAHAVDEMVDDLLTIEDVESAIMKGRVVRISRDDPRGPRQVIHGPAVDRRISVAVVGRFGSTGRYVIITVYALDEEPQDAG